MIAEKAADAIKGRKLTPFEPSTRFASAYRRRPPPRTHQVEFPLPLEQQGIYVNPPSEPRSRHPAADHSEAALAIAHLHQQHQRVLRNLTMLGSDQLDSSHEPEQENQEAASDWTTYRDDTDSLDSRAHSDELIRRRYDGSLIGQSLLKQLNPSSREATAH